MYALPNWNEDSKKIDTAVLFVKDSKSNRIVQIELQESEPDSSIFSGYFSLNWNKKDPINPQVYIPPRNFDPKKDNFQNISKLISNGTLKRKPFVLKKDDDGFQMIDVYDTKAQALAAYSAYVEQLKLKKDKQKPKPKIQEEDKQAAIEAARKASLEAEKERLAQEGAKRESDRIRMEQLEKQKAEESVRKQKLLAKKEIELRKEKAKKIAEKALEHYQKSDFKKASRFFEKSIELDPSNQQYYYQFGVSLYRIEEYNKALVYLRMAEGSSVNLVEKNYFIGLTHWRLKEYKPAITAFNEVKKANDPVMSPAAAFYMGIIEFSDEHLEAAKTEFEFVLDHSKDPKLDKQAEEYIEKILAIMRFKQNQATKFLLTGMYGLGYDSNVSQKSLDQLSTGESPTDLVGIRNTLMLGLEYRPIYEINHEFSAKFMGIYMKTYDSGFQEKTDFDKIDPTVLSLALPYKYKGKLFEKAYVLTLSPGYEVIQMDPEATGSRSDLIRSGFLNIDNLFVNNENWISIYKLGIRSDDTTNDSDSDAIKYSLAYDMMYFLNEKKNKILLGTLAYTLNSANGDDSKFNKMNLSIGYIAPWIWEMTWNTKLSYYQQAYPNHSSDRTDNNASLALGCSKAFTEALQSSLSLNYTSNTSTIESSTFDKYSLTFSLIWNKGF